jgi:hypothetical protein
MTMAIRCVLLVSLVLAVGAAPATRPAKGPSTAPSPTTKKVTFESVMRGRIGDAIDQLNKDSDFDKARETLWQVFDEITLNAPDKSEDLFRDADFALRLVAQVGQYDETKRVSLFKYLRENEPLARTLTFVVKPEEEKPDAIYALLDRLRHERPKLVPKYINLTAAICVVHDIPLIRHVNENVAEAIDPIALFDYFVKNEAQMYYGVKNVPPELLIYIVDATTSVEEMRWALNKYHGNVMIGGAFFDVPYDYENFTKGTPKKITNLGFNLPNILKYGGVCADQAYYAMSVGKAMGFPTAFTWGAAGESSHAWVGYLQNVGKRGLWNFDEGRYEAYRGVRGNVLDPQTRQEIPDSYVSLLAEEIGSRDQDRQAAVALTDAAKRLTELEQKLESYSGATAGSEWPGARPKPRQFDTASEMALIDLALRQNSSYAPAWLTLREMAAAKKLSLDQKRVVADALVHKCGTYPDFTFDILKPMIETVPDVNDQNKIWDGAFKMFQNRADLAAAVRMAQADLWEGKGDTTKAGKCYLEVIDKFTNSGPFVIDALARAEKLLVESRQSNNVVTLYEGAWKKIPRPMKSFDPYMHQSNWYRIGQLYAQRLQQSGQLAKADQILLTLDGGSSTAKAK